MKVLSTALTALPFIILASAAFAEPGQTRSSTDDGKTFVKVESVPSGARVELGFQEVNGVEDYTTGRLAGHTPCSCEVRASDVNAHGLIRIRLRHDGYMDRLEGLANARRAITKGGTFAISDRPIVLKPGTSSLIDER